MVNRQEFVNGPFVSVSLGIVHKISTCLKMSYMAVRGSGLF